MRLKPHINWIMTVPVISTAHITLADHDHLEGKPRETPGFLASTSYGWIFCLDEVEPHDFPDLSEAFRQLIGAFKNEGHFKYLRLDADGDVIPDLPTFEW